MKLKAKKPNLGQSVYYCPYCSRTSLLYLWYEDRLFGLGLDRWLLCPKCNHKFKIGCYGIREQELDIGLDIINKQVNNK